MGRVRWGLLATPVVRLACGSPVYRALRPPVGARAPRDACCRDGTGSCQPSWSEGNRNTANSAKGVIRADFRIYRILSSRGPATASCRVSLRGAGDKLPAAIGSDVDSLQPGVVRASDLQVLAHSALPAAGAQAQRHQQLDSRARTRWRRRDTRHHRARAPRHREPVLAHRPRSRRNHPAVDRQLAGSLPGSLSTCSWPLSTRKRSAVRAGARRVAGRPHPRRVVRRTRSARPGNRRSGQPDITARQSRVVGSVLTSASNSLCRRGSRPGRCRRRRGPGRRTGR